MRPGDGETGKEQTEAQGRRLSQKCPLELGWRRPGGSQVPGSPAQSWGGILFWGGDATLSGEGNSFGSRSFGKFPNVKALLVAGGSPPQGGFILGNLERWVETEGGPSRGLPKQIT